MAFGLGQLADAKKDARAGWLGVSAETDTDRSGKAAGARVILCTPSVIGENILISWNCSTEQATATSAALPLLRQAKAVTILTIEGLTVPGPSGLQARDWLAANGVQARELSIGNGGKKPGEVLLSEAAKLGADLIVKGAYTQSRLRQMIFGGMTRHLILNSPLPVLFSY